MPLRNQWNNPPTPEISQAEVLERLKGVPGILDDKGQPSVKFWDIFESLLDNQASSLKTQLKAEYKPKITDIEAQAQESIAEMRSLKKEDRQLDTKLARMQDNISQYKARQRELKQKKGARDVKRYISIARGLTGRG